MPLQYYRHGLETKGQKYMPVRYYRHGLETKEQKYAIRDHNDHNNMTSRKRTEICAYVIRDTFWRQKDRNMPVRYYKHGLETKIHKYLGPRKKRHT